MSDDDLKKRVVNLLKDVEPTKIPKKTKNPPRAKAIPSTSLSIVGNDNYQAAGDIYINKKETVRNNFTPGPEHITAAQARKIQRLVEKAVSIEELAGLDRPSLFAKWWNIVKNQYNVTTYKEIPAYLGDSAISWLTQKIAILRPKLRRKDNDSWRKEHYAAIWARSKQLGMSKGEVYALAQDRLNTQIVSLTNLGERNLKKLYQIIMAL